MLGEGPTLSIFNSQYHSKSSHLARLTRAYSMLIPRLSCREADIGEAYLRVGEAHLRDAHVTGGGGGVFSSDYSGVYREQEASEPEAEVNKDSGSSGFKFSTGGSEEEKLDRGAVTLWGGGGSRSQEGGGFAGRGKDRARGGSNVSHNTTKQVKNNAHRRN